MNKFSNIHSIQEGSHNFYLRFNGQIKNDVTKRMMETRNSARNFVKEDGKEI
jgi:hypothetical protein